MPPALEARSLNHWTAWKVPGRALMGEIPATWKADSRGIWNHDLLICNLNNCSMPRSMLKARVILERDDVPSPRGPYVLSYISLETLNLEH